MAQTSFPTNDPVAVKLWSAKLYHDAIGETFFGKFMSKEDSSIIQEKPDTSKGPGDRIRCTIRRRLTGDGQSGDSVLEGNEEALDTFTHDLLIDQLRHATRSAGKMSEQRVPFSVREENRMALVDWWAERLDISMANVLTGYTAQTDVRYTGMNLTTAPTRIIVGGGNTNETQLALDSGDAIKLADLDKAVALAKTTGSAGRERIRPLKVGGKKMYVCFLHPYQIYQLRRDASTQGNFWDLQRAQLQGGKIADNTLLTGADFMYNNVIVHEWSYLPNIVGTPSAGTVADYKRGVFCGAQAAVFARGQEGRQDKMTWVEELFDYGNQLGVSAGMIFGMNKVVFGTAGGGPNVDFGTIVLSGYAPEP